MYYVNARWLGGMLTNFKTMRTRVDRLAQLKKMQEDGTFDMLPKKEVMKHMGEMAHDEPAKEQRYVLGIQHCLYYHSATEPSAWRHTGFFQWCGVVFSSSTNSRLTSTPSPGSFGRSTKPSTKRKSSPFLT